MNYVQPIRDKELLEAIKKHLKEKNERNYMLFNFGINTGLRISDLLNFKKEDVFGKQQLVLVERKTKKRKFLPISKRLQVELKRYCKDMENGDYLFPSRQGVNQPVCRQRAYQMLRETAEEFGLEHIGTHTLRKTFGYHFYKKKKDVAILQEIFNHSSPDITLRYIGINQDSINEALSDFNL
ncbi:site-specific integrase [Planococcus soli]|uniref:site-specific integrase n=1 Tax=Planococcus soli TaxID=2666072 RepID=UPI00115DD5C6|nr:site-specific integrase [Planococcus soli]